MSTRANIFIHDNDKEKENLYHHYDGGPEGVGRDLERILMKLNTEECKHLTRKELALFICKEDPYFSNITPYSAADAEYEYNIYIPQRLVYWEHLYTGEQDLLCCF